MQVHFCPNNTFLSPSLNCLYYLEFITLALGDMAEIMTSSMCPLRLAEDVGVLYTIHGAW